MKELVYEFFGIAGLDTTAPLTFPDLLVWFVCVFVALMLVLCVFRCFSSIISTIITFFVKMK